MVKSKLMRLSLFAAAALPLAVLCVGPAVAQPQSSSETTLAATPKPTTQSGDQVSPAANSPAKDSVVGEVVVTANRTSSLASKTPITLTAVTADRLASQGITNPTQLGEAVPNLTIDRGNQNGLQLNIRGVSSTGVTSPSVAFLLDGIYVLNPNAQAVSFYDLDRVEVLRGPQGTLYGRNTTAGVVNIISASPKSTYGGYIDINSGNYNARQVTAAINVPIDDKLAVRLAANYDFRDSYFRQTVPNPYKLPPDTDNKSVRLSVLYRPISSLKTLFKLDYSHLSGTGTGFGDDPTISNFYQTPLTVPSGTEREPNPVYLNPSSSQALSKGYADAAAFHSDDSTWGATGELDWTINPDLSLTYLGGYRQFSRRDTGSVFWGTDETTTPATDSAYTASTSVLSNTLSHELRLSYDTADLKLQTGGYYYFQRQNQFILFNSFGLPQPISYQQSIGVFAQGTYSIVPQWRVTGGLRYTQDDVRQDGGTELMFGGMTIPLSYSSSVGGSHKLTYKVETDYDLTRNTLAYATIATGYKAIGFNSNCIASQPGCTYQPETLTDYEAGVKTRLLDGRLTMNADYFHYDYNNLQISQIVSQTIDGVSTPSSVTTNAAAAKVDGVELEGSFIPLPRNRLDFSATYLDARYINYQVSPSDPASGNYDGDPLDHSPRWTLTLGYTYTQPLPTGANLVASVRTRYSDQYAMLNTVTQSQFVQPGFTKTDLSLRYNSPDSRYYVEGYVRNLENNIEVTYINTSPGWPELNNGTVNVGDPRTYGVRVGAHF
ncbi:MAG: TonB-dependent receptor [Caulobacteraceae bacterium]